MSKISYEVTVAFTITAKDRIHAYRKSYDYINERQLLRDSIERFTIPVLVNAYDYGDDETLETEFEFQIPITIVEDEYTGLMGLKKVTNQLLVYFENPSYDDCMVRTIKIARAEG